MAEALVVGQVARIWFDVTDIAGQAADPGSLVLKVKPGVGAIANYAYGVAPEIVRDGVGKYHAEIPLTGAGQWAYRLELSAPNAGACEGVIVVQKSRVI